MELSESAAEQRRYARWLDFAARCGLVALVITFLVYVSGLAGAHVPLEQLPSLWTLPLEEYRARTGAPAGWGWLALAYKGDYLSLVGVALLALATLACYVPLASAFFRKGERLQAWLAVAQVVVLLAAASGLIGGGH